MKYQEWQKRPERFLAMTGCNIEVFNKLPPYFEEAHNECLKEYLRTSAGCTISGWKTRRFDMKTI